MVSSPANLPLAGVLVRIMNDSYTLASTNTGADGAFIITVEKSQIDATYRLSLYDAKYDVQKDIALTGFGLTEYDFGNIVFYDKRNPYDLPVLNKSGVSYVIHPPLDLMTYKEAVTACERLNDYGLNDWFIPSADDLASALQQFGKSEQYPLTVYWASTVDVLGYQVAIFWKGDGTEKTGSKNESQKYRVLPFHTLQ